ncbi:protein HESO1-like isoform X1 [Quillaja saponaria]|uniref:Protein HESO1-like isoform X1 n=1 Tax=Quillaja saponaria TaxID=32244 RepID=A0AAD7LF71_QUISA|nr:protein HESO1-like isoform X1 [Quillaja saponaria]
MESSERVPKKEAKECESKELARIKIPAALASNLNALLQDAYAIRSPKPIDYFNRTDLVRIFNVIAKEIYGNSGNSPVVEGYGSFVMDMFSVRSDLDLSINFSNSAVEIPRHRKIETLRKFAKKLYSIQRGGHVAGVQTIMTARVPIVKVTDRGTGIECDLSVDNRDGIGKSQIIHAISAIDERFKKLSLLMKTWAKVHNINSSKDRTLNSLSIISIVAFHLQTCNPPILPPFSALFKEGTDPATVTAVIRNYLNYGKKNNQSLAELFITLFVKLASVEFLWGKGLCVSLYEGSWVFKSWDFRNLINIEDFTDRSENVARAVGTEEVKKIYRCIHDSLHYIVSFLDGQLQGTKLMDLLFGTYTISTVGNRGTGDVDVRNAHNSQQAKRIRLMQVGEENQPKKTSEQNLLVEGWGGKQQQRACVGAQQTDGRSGMRLARLETLQNVATSFVPAASRHSPQVAHGLYNNLHYSYDPLKVPSVLPPNTTNFEGSHHQPIHPHFVSPQSSVGFAGSYSQMQVAPTPYIGSIHHAKSPQIRHRQ